MTPYVVSALTTASILPAVVMLLSNFKSQPSTFRWLAVLLSFSFLCDVAAFLLYHSGMNQNAAGAFYWLFSTIMISGFFLRLVPQSFRRSFLVMNVLYLLFALTNIFLIQGARIQSYTQSIQAVIIIILCIGYYYVLIKELPTEQIHRLPTFWITSAFFFSYAGKLVIYAVVNYLTQYLKDNLVIIMNLHNLLTIIANTVFAYAAWLNRKQQRFILSSRSAS
ncbi:MAG TPA: hypothetical protein VD927_07780 [Chryseosolibacter sp.]|nr:hypothetical protein [Chryseosolibacter sp.]